MKILLDTCVWGGAKTELLASGHDVVWTGEWERDPGDEAILEYARNEQRVLVTLDKDFGELIFAQGRLHFAVIRIVDYPAELQGKVCQQILDQYQQDILRSAVITAEPGRVRIRSIDSLS